MIEKLQNVDSILVLPPAAGDHSVQEDGSEAVLKNTEEEYESGEELKVEIYWKWCWLLQGITVWSDEEKNKQKTQ